MVTTITIIGIILGSIPTGFGLGFASEWGKEVYRAVRKRINRHKQELITYLNTNHNRQRVGGL